jgi:hypothetical protein
VSTSRAYAGCGLAAVSRDPRTRRGPVTRPQRAGGEGGIEVASEQAVAVLKVEDRPGVMGEVSRQLGNAVVNINLGLPGNQQAAGVRRDDIAAAKAALGQ